jgi:hypothetical protein
MIGYSKRARIRPSNRAFSGTPRGGCLPRLAISPRRIDDMHQAAPLPYLLGRLSSNAVTDIEAHFQSIAALSRRHGLWPRMAMGMKAMGMKLPPVRGVCPHCFFDAGWRLNCFGDCLGLDCCVCFALWRPLIEVERRCADAVTRYMRLGAGRCFLTRASDG